MESDRLVVYNRHKTAIPFFWCVAWMLRAPGSSTPLESAWWYSSSICLINILYSSTTQYIFIRTRSSTSCWHINRGWISLVDVGKIWETCSSPSIGGCPTSSRVSVNYMCRIVELRVCTSLTITLIMMFLIVSVEHFCRRVISNSGPVRTCTHFLFLRRNWVMWWKISWAD